jgi:hypothetical protein
MVHYPIRRAELDYTVMAHAQNTIFKVQVEQTSQYSLTADMSATQFSLLLAACFCIGVAHNGLTHSTVLFLFTFLPLCMFVPTHSNQALHRLWPQTQLQARPGVTQWQKSL